MFSHVSCCQPMPSFLFHKVGNQSGTNTEASCPRVHFSASCKKSQVASYYCLEAWSHSLVLWSRFFEREAMGCGVFPRVWISISGPIPCLSWMYNLKDFCKVGNPSWGAKMNFPLKVSNATLQSLVHSRIPDFNWISLKSSVNISQIWREIPSSIFFY